VADDRTAEVSMVEMPSSFELGTSQMSPTQVHVIEVHVAELRIDGCGRPAGTWLQELAGRIRLTCDQPFEIRKRHWHRGLFRNDPFVKS
jgi:hypothetical protein